MCRVAACGMSYPVLVLLTYPFPASLIVCKCMRVSARVAFVSFFMLVISALADSASALNTL